MMLMVISGWMGHASLHHPLQHVLRVRQLGRCLPLLAQHGHWPDVSYHRLNLRLLQNHRLRPHSPLYHCHHHIHIIIVSVNVNFCQTRNQYFRYGQYIPIIVLVVTTFTIIEAAGAADEYPALPDTDEVTHPFHHQPKHQSPSSSPSGQGNCST